MDISGAQPLCFLDCAMRCLPRPNPAVCPWGLQRGEAQLKLAISDADSPKVHVYDTSTGSDEPIASVEGGHNTPVQAMKYNRVHNCVISADAQGAAQGLPHLRLRLLRVILPILQIV